MDSLDGYVADDDLAIGPLAELGWEVETLSWRTRSVDWDIFEAVVIRTTWDYQRDPDAFLNVLRRIEASDARLENSLEIVRWTWTNRMFATRIDGVNIMPSLWERSYDTASFGGWLDELGCEEVIIKPTVSATAEHTYRLQEFDPRLTATFAERPFVVQPFLPSIVTEGEYSYSISAANLATPLSRHRSLRISAFRKSTAG